MKLTKGEIAALMHRVEVPECIFESLGRGDADCACVDDEFDAAMLKVSQQVQSGEIDTASLSPLEAKILGDCLDCGTYWGCADYESSQKKVALNKIGWSLVDKFEADGIPVDRSLLIFCSA